MSSFIVIEYFSEPIVVTNESGNAKIFTTLKDANAEVENCLKGIIVPLDETIIPEFINKIDFTTLRTQKTTLLNVIDGYEKNNINTDDLEGILILIDAIQDYAVDVLEIPSIHVFDFELEEKRNGKINEDNGYF